MSPEGGCRARCPGPSGGFLLLGIQVLYVLLDPRQLGVATELLALPGGEAVGRRQNTHDAGRGGGSLPFLRRARGSPENMRCPSLLADSEHNVFSLCVCIPLFQKLHVHVR